MISRTPSQQWYKFATELEQTMDADLSGGPEMNVQAALSNSPAKSGHRGAWFLAGALAAGALGLVYYCATQDTIFPAASKRD
jgi:hypothetical protein